MMIAKRGIRLHFFSVSELSCCTQKNRFDGSKSKILLEPISFHLAKGETIFVIGASGSGKSTLLKAISFFHTNTLVQTGQINLAGQSLQALNSKVFLLQQDPILLPHLQVIDQFRLIGLDLINDKKIAELSIQFQIDHLMSAYPQALSGGEAQRVALVRALLMSPSVLLLDEPFAHLDLYLRKKLKRMLWQDLKKRQITSLWVTHDLMEVKEGNCRIIWMENGKGLIFDGWQAMCEWEGSLLLKEMIEA